MAYLLDADAFIRAKRLHYGFDFCPAFWDWLIKAHADGSVFSVEKVGYELRAGDDELSEWALDRGNSFFLPPDQATIPALKQVSAWISDKNYSIQAIDKFLEVADYYLVAQALAGKHAIVTHEIPSNSRCRIKIPNACIGLGIKCLTPFQMLRNERVRFMLGPLP